MYVHCTVENIHTGQASCPKLTPKSVSKAMPIAPAA